LAWPAFQARRISQPFVQRTGCGTGIPWRDLPERFGDWKIVYQRFNRWAKSGVFERVFRLLASDHDNEYMMIDATIVRAHQHSAGAQKKTARKPSADPAAD
jgi:transposase